MHQSFTSHNRFERLVAELFIKLGFADVKTNIEYCGSLGHNYEIDILYGEQGNATVVEVKYYRPNSPPRTELIHRALRQIRTIRQEAKVKNSMLVISCAINEGVRILAKEFSDVEIWDIEKILEKARPFPTLFKDFLIALELDFNSFEIVGDSSANQDQDNEGSAKRGAILSAPQKVSLYKLPNPSPISSMARSSSSGVYSLNLSHSYFILCQSNSIRFNSGL